jgi:DNA repair exonuclease SbcCD nuclease subunit
MEASMPGRPFRFVHASDFHLERPPYGVAEVPDHLRSAWLDAAYTAAGRVFDAVLAEEAEFLILSGDILRSQDAGLRGPVFLAEQFARLAQRGIAVYWAGGEVDPPDAWPTAPALPENVHVFRRGPASEILHMRQGSPLARLVGQSRDGQRPIRVGEFDPDPAGLFSIAVAHGPADAAALAARGMHYWALGGRHERTMLSAAPAIAHDPGSPQGRCPEESGVHGCTLVQVDEQGQARTSPIPTDALRWVDERLVLESAATREDLEGLLRARVRSLLETTPQRDLLISWTIAGAGLLVAQLREAALEAQLLDWLRGEYGMTAPAAWSVALEVEPTEVIPEALYEGETILGDFLRAVRQVEMNPSEPIELEPYLAESHLAGTMAAAAVLPEGAPRQRVLHAAALVGLDLLGGKAAP